MKGFSTELYLGSRDGLIFSAIARRSQVVGYSYRLRQPIDIANVANPRLFQKNQHFKDKRIPPRIKHATAI